MKRLRISLTLFLSLVLLIMMLPCSVYATDTDQLPAEIPAESKDQDGTSPVPVTNLEELLSAMDAAEDGDTIVLKNQIDILENCIIGSEEKTITLAPAEDFSGDALISLWAYDQQEITIKNLLLDGKSYPQVSAMITNFADTSAEVRGTIHLENMMVSNFSSWRSTVLVSSLSAVIDGCRFMNNQSNRTAGIEIAPNATAEILGCEFYGNTSKGNGGAIYCRGQAVITNSIIENNTALNVDTAVRNGGGVYVDENASCKITACKITKNVSDLGGGIAVYGNTNITDTFLCGNQGTKGASDIKATSGVQLEVNYSDGMQTIYTENDPIGFYVDDFENPFDAENHAVLLGETISGTITNGQFGAKFIFAGDLPEETPPTEDTDPIPPEVPPSDNEEDNDPSDGTDNGSSRPSYPSRPSRPTYPVTPPSQPDNTSKLELVCGKAVLDTEKPLSLTGYGDGLLHEQDPTTRAQIAVLLHRALTTDSKNTLSSAQSPFSDVKQGTWYYDAVSALASAGVVSGCDGLFRPDDTLTLGQLITMLTRFVEAQTTVMPTDISYSEHWAYDNFVTAVAYGWIEDASNIDPNRPVTRGEVVEFVNSIFEGCI